MADGGPSLARVILSRILQQLLDHRPPGISESYILEFFARNEQGLLDVLAPGIERLQRAGRSIGPAILPEFWTPRQRTEANLTALRLLATKLPHELTPADRELLARYSGWGGLSLRDVRDFFPSGLPAPEERGLIHEYYTPTRVCREVARVVTPLLPGLGDDLIALEPSAGIGRFLRAFQGPAFAKLRWQVCEWSEVSGRLLAALFPEVDLFVGPFERWVFQRGARWQGRIHLVISSPPYGPRGSSIAEDPVRAYREKMAYHYFLRRALDLLAPGGLGVFLVPGGFLTSRTAAFQTLREKILRRHHLSTAYRLPSVRAGGRDAIFPGANLVTDLLFFRARGGELDEVDAADRGILEGGYYQEFPDHILGQEIGKDGGEDDQTAKPRWGYGVVGEFTTLPDIRERALCDACNVAWFPPPGPQTGGKATNTGVIRGDLGQLEGTGEAEVDLALQLGARVDRYLSLVAAQVPGEPAQLWPELHDALQLWVDRHGIPAAHLSLAESARKGNAAAQRFLTAFDRTGTLVDALQAPPPEPEPLYNGSPDDVAAQAELLYRHRQHVLPLGTLIEFHQGQRGSLDLEAILRGLFAADWNLDGPGWDLLVPKEDYLTGDLWKKYDLAGRIAQHPPRSLPEWAVGARAEEQRKALLAAMHPAFYDDIEGVSPRQAWIPLELVQGWMEKSFPHGYGTLVRQNGLLTVEGYDYEQEGLPAAWTMPIGWINHDKTYFRPPTSRDEDIDEVRLKFAKEWDASFKAWISLSPERQQKVVDAYNRQFRGYITPTYSAETLPIARWAKDGPRLRAHQVAGARRVLAHRGGLVAFDVGVGKTYTALGILARARQEGWAKRPVILLPNSIIWKWVEDFQRTLPDYRVGVVGSKRKIIQHGPRKGELTSDTDTPEERAATWTRFQGGEYDVVLLTYSALPRTRMNERAVLDYVEGVTAIRREIALKRRNANKKAELSERAHALLTEGTAAWVAEKLEIPESWSYDPGPTWDDIGIDLLIVDEAQNYKNLYGPAEREGGVPRFMGSASEGSDRAWQLDFRCAAVRRKTGGSGIVLLSATPAKNSPLEFYNLIQYVDPGAWSRMGIHDPEQFIDRYVRTEIKQVLNTRMEVEARSAAVGFMNLHELRDVIFRYGEFKTAEEVGLKLPEPKVEMVEVDMDPRQEAKYQRYVAEIADALKNPQRGAGQVLGLLARLALVAIHADLDGGYDWKNAGTVGDPDSPKFSAVADRVMLNKGCGHIIFCDNVAAHRWMRDVLVRRGITPERIAMLNAKAAASPAERQQIARDFNGDPETGRLPKYDIVIANAIAYEGVDLQTRTCAIHHIDLPWEPATLQQRNGRGVRQGNTLANISIYYYFARRSQDGMRFSLIQGKRGWMTELIKSQDRATNNPGAQMEMGPEEILLMISRNPEETRKRLEEVRAKREAEARAKLAEECNRNLRGINGRFRQAERTRDPEVARSLRAEAEARLEQLMQVNPEAWPWAPWIGVIRQQPVLAIDGSGPVFSGLRLAIPNPRDPSQITWAELGKVDTTPKVGMAATIGYRVAGQALWRPVTPGSKELEGLQPGWYGGAGWPVDDDTRTLRALQEQMDSNRYGFGYGIRAVNAPTAVFSWHLAPDDWLERIWPQAETSLVALLQMHFNRSGTPQRLPMERSGRMILGNAPDLRDHRLIGPTLSGWHHFLELAPASGLSFSDLDSTGQAWWGRRIPRNLLSAAGEADEEEE